MTRRHLLAASAALAGCARDRRPHLNILNWSAYIAPDTVPKFEAAFNVRIRYAVYESNEEMFARVASGNSGWDIVFPSASFIPPMLAEDLLDPLDHRRLPNLIHLDPAFQHPVHDPQLHWSVPYMTGAAGIVYNRSLTPAPTAWANLWDQRLRGRITMLDDPTDVFAACLKRLGKSVNSEDPADLRAAAHLAIAQKPLLRAFINAEVRDQLLSGDVLAAQMWATTAQQAIDESDRIAFVYPREGYPAYLDTTVILRESSRAELAHHFLNFLLRPDIAAANALASRTSTTNRVARQLLPAAFRDNPTRDPPPALAAPGGLEIALRPETLRLRDRLWTEIKSA
jgi:spermidine/putrescine transport system substrate-binding protein